MVSRHIFVYCLTISSGRGSSPYTWRAILRYAFSNCWTLSRTFVGLGPLSSSARIGSKNIENGTIGIRWQGNHPFIEDTSIGSSWIMSGIWPSGKYFAFIYSISASSVTNLPHLSSKRLSLWTTISTYFRWSQTQHFSFATFGLLCTLSTALF